MIQVTAITAAYNAASYIENCIQSVLAQTGWASTACIITFIGGVQLFCMGIMGQYIAKTYMEVKQRPHYIVAESNRAEVTRIK